MKRNTHISLIITLMITMVVLSVLHIPVSAQEEEDPQVEVTATPEPESIPSVVPNRPLLYIVDYTTGDGKISVNPYGSFGMTFTLGNNGRPQNVAKPDPNDPAHARNIVMSFNSEEFDPLDGSLISIFEVDANNAGNETRTHHFRVNDMSTWKYSGLITATVSYTDGLGLNQYTDTFIFTITINQSGAVASTATPSGMQGAQMVVDKYSTDIDPLQPGSSFKLTLETKNAGNELARNVSLVYGGSTITTNPEGTPEVGGVSGGAGDLSVFAPIGNSNVALLGDVEAGSSLSIEQEFVVNVTTQPGAYPLKLSFVYTDAKGNRVIDDKLITLLVFTLPQLEISFYNPVEGMLSAGQMGSLPIQITNLARKAVVLGNVVVTSTAGEMNNNSVLIGTLEPGGYFTIDPMFTPFQDGTVTINLEIRYTDDFNQLRTYNSQLEVEVLPEMTFPELFPLLDENGNPILDEFGNPIMVDSMDTEPFPGEPSQELGFFAKIWAAIKGFFGFGTAE